VRLLEEGGELANTGLRLLKTGESRQLEEAVDEVAEPRDELAGPSEPDEHDFRLREGGTEGAKRRHSAKEVAEHERAQDGDPPRGERRDRRSGCRGHASTLRCSAFAIRARRSSFAQV
jgi:hypothetical protein